MPRLLQLLLFGHYHKWTTIKEVRLTDPDSDLSGRRYYQQCETCGKVIKRDLI